jgi:hypothetical protein
VPESDDRHPLANRGVDRVDDVPAALVAQRAAHLGAVGCEGDDRRAVDLAARGQHARVVTGVQLAQRPAVEQRPQA